MSEQLPNPNPVEQGEMPDQRPEASSRQEADGVGAERPGAQRQAAQRSADPVRVASSVGSLATFAPGRAGSTHGRVRTGPATVTGTSNFYTNTTLSTGTGNDAVNVENTTGTLYVDNPGGQDSVFVGSNGSALGGTVQGINGTVLVVGAGAS